MLITHPFSNILKINELSGLILVFNGIVIRERKINVISRIEV